MHDRRDRIGLCAECRHVREIGSRRGSVFFLCERAESDPRYARYPRLPVVDCRGFEPRGEEPGGPASDE